MFTVAPALSLLSHTTFSKVSWIVWSPIVIFFEVWPFPAGTLAWSCSPRLVTYKLNVMSHTNICTWTTSLKLWLELISNRVDLLSLDQMYPQRKRIDFHDHCCSSSLLTIDTPVSVLSFLISSGCLYLDESLIQLILSLCLCLCSHCIAHSTFYQQQILGSVEKQTNYINVIAIS